MAKLACDTDVTALGGSRRGLLSAAVAARPASNISVRHEALRPAEKGCETIRERY